MTEPSPQTLGKGSPPTTEEEQEATRSGVDTVLPAPARTMIPAPVRARTAAEPPPLAVPGSVPGGPRQNARTASGGAECGDAQGAPSGGDAPTAESVRFGANGAEWLARVAGWTATGRPGDPGVTLTLVTFSAVEAPETPVMEVLREGVGLDGLNDSALTELFLRARPFAGRGEGGKVFEELRPRGSGER